MTVKKKRRSRSWIACALTGWRRTATGTFRIRHATLATQTYHCIPGVGWVGVVAERRRSRRVIDRQSRREAVVLTVRVTLAMGSDFDGHMMDPKIVLETLRDTFHECIRGFERVDVAVDACRQHD